MYQPSTGKTRRKLRRQTLALGGLDRSREAKVGALADSIGLDFSQTPCLATRRGRRLVREVEQGSALFAWDALYTVEGTSLCRDGVTVATVLPGKKEFAVVGGKLCIFPDRKYLDLGTLTLHDLAARVSNRPGLVATFTEDTLSFQGEISLGSVASFTRNRRPKMNASDHRSDTGEYYYMKFYDAVSWDPDTGWTTSGERELWLMDSAVKNQVGKYVILQDPGIQAEPTINMKKVQETREANGGNNVVDTKEVLYDYGPDSQQGFYGLVTDVKMVSNDGLYYGEQYVWDVTITVEYRDAGSGAVPLEGRFFPGDRVYISGASQEYWNTPQDQPLTVQSVSGHTMTFVTPKGEEWVFVPGVDTGEVTVERRIPDLACICQWDGRLVGGDRIGRRIWASARGDPRNFEAYDGKDTDSWNRTVESAGGFTGCIATSGAALFWEEDRLHRLTGTRPDLYRLESRQVPGVQEGCGASLAVVNDVVYYVGRDGVYTYGGTTTPRRVSAPLGDWNWERAAGGGLGEVYRVCLARRDTEAWEWFDYHIPSGRWLREGPWQEAVGFAALGGTLYVLTSGGLWALDQDGDDGEEPIGWEATFNPFTEEVMERKYPSRLLLWLELAPGAWAEAELARDGGAFTQVWTGHGPEPRPVIPIRLGRCDSYQLRLKGQGRCVVQSLEREFSLGSLR